MIDQLAPIAYTLFAWWFSTGAILYVVGLPKRTHRWSMAVATLLMLAALATVAATAAHTGKAASYAAFTASLVVWGWQETAFLLGYVTGPRRLPCPAHARGWRRAGYAFQVVQHHECALVAIAVTLVALTWGQPNQGALATFAILWTMRQSAKLNLFLGVRNLNERFLPVHLDYLPTYFRRRRMNALFPLSLLGASIATVVSWHAVQAGGADELVGAVLAATLLSLGLLEHCLMVLPLPSEALWNWGLRSRH